MGITIDNPSIVQHNHFLQRLFEKEHIIVLLIIPIFLSVLFIFIPNALSYWTSYLWLFPIAFLIALVVNMLGISGATLFVPFFSIILPLFTTGFSPTESVIIGLITQSFGISSATLSFFRYGLIDMKVVMISFLGVIPIVIISSFCAVFLPTRFLFAIICISLLIAVISLYYAKSLNKAIGKEKSENMTIILHIHSGKPSPAILVDRYGKVYSYCRCGHKIRLLGHSIGGALQGVTGFGIGELGMVGMIVSGIPLKVGIGSNHIIVAVSAITASLTYIIRSSSITSIEIPWNVIAITVPAVIVGAQFSPFAADRINTEILEKMLMGLLIFLAFSLLYLGVLS